jgi:hypothetical protein
LTCKQINGEGRKEHKEVPKGCEFFMFLAPFAVDFLFEAYFYKNLIIKRRKSYIHAGCTRGTGRDFLVDHFSGCAVKPPSPA